MKNSIAIFALALAIFSGSALANRVVEKPVGTVFCVTKEAYVKYIRGVKLGSGKDGKPVCFESENVYRVRMVKDADVAGLWEFVDYPKEEKYWSKSAGSSSLFKAISSEATVTK